MTVPIRPQDAGGIYRRQAIQAEGPAEGSLRRTDGSHGAISRRTDSVTVSEGAREFARIMEAVQHSPDIRHERVELLRERIESGNYVVDATGLAALLADRGFSS